MAFGRIGGWLVVGGWLLFALSAAIVAGGGPVGPDGALGSQTVVATVALVGLGAAVLGVAGAKPMNGRGERIGLGILGVGLLCGLAASIIANGKGLDSPAILPALALIIVGTPATVLGALITVVSLLRAHGRSRQVGLLLVGGVVLLILSGIASKMTVQQTLPLDAVAFALAVLGCAVVVLGGAGIGILVINGDRQAAVASA